MLKHSWQWVLTGFFAILPLAAAAQSVALVSSEKDNTLTIINLKDQKVEGTIATCKRPRHLQLTPDGKQVLVACGGDNAADVIDVATRKSVGRIPLGDNPEAFDISPDGKVLYVSNEDEGELTFIDIAAKKAVTKTSFG